MSENSELIQQHLQPHSVALLVGTAREEGPAVAANSVQIASNLVCSSAVSVTGWEERRCLMKEAGLFY